MHATKYIFCTMPHVATVYFCRCDFYSSFHEDNFVLNLVFILIHYFGVYEPMYLSSEKCLYVRAKRYLLP